MPSSIEWTDETWNPVTGCTRVSPGCDHCYMFALYPRLRGMNVRGYETAPDDVQLLPERLQAPLSWKKPRRVFVNSMSDVFHPDVPFDYVLEMFQVMQAGVPATRPHFPGPDEASGSGRRLVGRAQTLFPRRLAGTHLDGHLS